MIFELLGTGADNPITAKKLAKCLHVEPRDISAMIEKERREGKPICASCNGRKPGYYIPATRKEMENYCGRLLHRAGEIHKTRKACLQTLGRLPAD